MGEDPRVRGFFHGVGFNSAGMMLGGGCGDQLARWVAQGRPDLDMYGYDVRRFCPKVSQSKVWVDQRSHESYVKNYSMVFPHDEPLAGRNMKKDPLHDVLLTAGCVYQERFGWERPGWFTMHGPCPVKEYDWYGAYGNLVNNEYGYKERLNLDYTFEHTPIEENVRRYFQLLTFSLILLSRSELNVWPPGRRRPCSTCPTLANITSLVLRLRRPQTGSSLRGWTRRSARPSTPAC